MTGRDCSAQHASATPIRICRTPRLSASMIRCAGRSRVTPTPSRRSLWDGDPSGGRVGRKAGRRRRACWAGARPWRQRRDNAAAPRRHRPVAAIRPLPTEARALITPSSLVPARLAAVPATSPQQADPLRPGTRPPNLLRRRTIMSLSALSCVSGRHVARLHARPVDQWPGLLRRAPCRATRFVRPSPEASRPEFYDLDSRV